MILKTKTLFGLRWRNIVHNFWQSETIGDKTYFLCDTEPLAYQDYKTCNYVISTNWLDIHSSTKMMISKWIGLGTIEIKEMIKRNQYQLKPHNEFINELVEVGKMKRWGVKKI
jgi:hypothetical protein